METSPGQGTAMPQAPNPAPQPAPIEYNDKGVVFPPPTPPQSWEAPAAPQPAMPQASAADLIYALSLLCVGFCFWDWNSLNMGAAGFGTTVLFLAAIAASFVYLWVKGIRQNAQSLVMLAVALVGALPFALNGPRDINPLLVLFEVVFCLLWVMYSCRSALASKLTAIMAGDLFSQVFVVPFANISHFFTRPLKLFRRGGKTGGHVLLALLGLVICIPVFALVIWLLVSADNGFKSFVDNFGSLFDDFRAGQYLFELVGGIPIAAYIFGAVLGNTFKRHTNHFSEQGFLRGFNSAHALPKAMMYLPLALLALLYVVFFIAMGSYLFSGLTGQLPVTYTYAEYARQGFFQLCAVATINLVILFLVWLLAKRQPQTYPLALRLLSGLLTLLTCLLIITAMSKMLLYIQSYSLTPLRLYTSWFMLFLLVGFALLVAWHIKPFNAAKPIIILLFSFVLIAGLANTNAIIANYNVKQYLNGAAQTVDTNLLQDLGDPAARALEKLAQNAPDNLQKDRAQSALAQIRTAHKSAATTNNTGLTTWYGWQAQSLPYLLNKP